MLDVVNLSGFAHLTFGALDAQDTMVEVVVAKATYDLLDFKDVDGSLALVFSEEKSTVFVKDEYFGDVNRSSVRLESDLAPFKPKCDVVVIGSAHSPTGEPASDVVVGIEIRRDGAQVLRHHLRVYGEREFVRRDAFDRGAAALVWLASAGRVDAPDWRLTEAVPFVSCPLRYELAFGGEMRVEADHPSADRVPEENRLSEAARQNHPDGELAPIAHRACSVNPIGRGYVERWHTIATGTRRYPAPRVEAFGDPLDTDAFCNLMRGRKKAGSGQASLPQGFGVITKAWQPRLKLAGTFDENWRNSRWPNMPRDFDDGYWNGAHPAMQCEHLRGGETVSLTNLLPPDTTGVRRTSARETDATLRLPADELALRVELDDGRVAYLLLPIDTLVVDLDDRVVHLTWRLRVPADLPVKDASLMALAPIRARVASRKRAEAGPQRTGV